jgi:hypothetical protein
MSILKDKNEKYSSKRLAGFISLLAYIVISLYAVFKDPSQAGPVLLPLAGIVAGCFGATVLEKFKGGD